MVKKWQNVFDVFSLNCFNSTFARHFWPHFSAISLNSECRRCVKLVLQSSGLQPSCSNLNRHLLRRGTNDTNCCTTASV